MTSFPLHKSWLTAGCLAAFLLSLTACNSYLDELPDNRSELTSLDKIQKVLTSAYPINDDLFIAEFMSDNVDSYGDDNPNTNRFVDQVYHWEEITEANNQSPENFWEDCYSRIATANLALEALNEMGNMSTAEHRAARAEALLCRAYAHFLLVNLFSQAYNGQTSQRDLGIAYMTTPAADLAANPSRLSVAEVYELIDHDLQEALPMVSSNYKVTKYHFNQKAAYAFAARFYLYYEQWERAIEYANLCLGSTPAAVLRDWKYVASMTQSFSAVSQHYIDAGLSCNLMLLTSYSYMGLVFGPYSFLSKYSHGKYLAEHEDGEAANIWGAAQLYHPMATYAATNLDKTIFWKLPYLFEYHDAVAGTGWYRTVYPAFTTDETLLNRAEAYILTGQLDLAAADLNTWMHNIVNTQLQLTPGIIQDFYNHVEYSYSDERHIESTIKKHLHPKFDIGPEGEMTEAMLQCLLGFRRIETLQTGLRWYDVKRYGIEIVRRTIDASGQPDVLMDVLRMDDPRRAVQIPLRVSSAGVEKNPR